MCTCTVHIIAGLPNGPVLFCSLASVVCRRRLSASSVVVCNAAGGRAAIRHVGGLPPLGWARGRSGGRHCTAGQYGYVPPERLLVCLFIIQC